MTAITSATYTDLAYLGGTKAIATTPVIGQPGEPYPDVYVPGAEPIRDGEIRVTVLGSGNPPPTRAQASGSILVEVGNEARDLFIFDVGSGSLANFMSLGLPINSLDKVFLSHLHADHTADLITLFGSFRKAGRQGPLYVWGGDGSEPKFGTKVALDAIEAACAWDTESTRGFTSNESAMLVGTEFDAATTAVVYEQDGVTITAFPVIHGLHGRRRAGSGENFWQYRRFVSGEPSQNVDWRRSARDDHLYVRELEWEASHTVWIWPDVWRCLRLRSRARSWPDQGAPFP